MGGAEWPVQQSHPAIPWINFADGAEFSWHEWFDAFVTRFNELNQRRALQALEPVTA